jgi:hypothetical protein
MELFCLDALEVLADGGLFSGLRAPVAQQEGDPAQVLHLTNHSLSPTYHTSSNQPFGALSAGLLITD